MKWSTYDYLYGYKREKRNTEIDNKYLMWIYDHIYTKMFL